ncbi:MAG: hypothetical protein ACKV19_04330 [Verrucomicrobiales bacterium]
MRPKTLALLDKWFVVERRHGGGFYDRLGSRWDDYLNPNHQAPLPLELPEDPVWVEVYVADDIATQAKQVERLELRLQLTGGIDLKKAEVKFNGINMQNPTIKADWWTFTLTPRQRALGRNLLAIRHPKPGIDEKPISLEKVEVHVTYRPEKVGK